MQKLKFVEVSHHAASGRKPKQDGHLSGISIASDINLQRLIVNDSQRNGIENVYRDGIPFDRIFDNSQESQIEAVSLVAANELDGVSREALGNRWSIRWTNGSAEDTGVNGIYRVLYQWCVTLQTAAVKRNLTMMLVTVDTIMSPWESSAVEQLSILRDVWHTLKLR